MAIFVVLGVSFLNHGVSMAINYLGNKEYEKVSPVIEMYKVFNRFFIMQVAVMIIMITCVYVLNSAALFEVLILVMVKTLFDLGAHLKEHRHQA